MGASFLLSGPPAPSGVPEASTGASEAFLSPWEWRCSKSPAAPFASGQRDPAQAVGLSSGEAAHEKPEPGG